MQTNYEHLLITIIEDPDIALQFITEFKFLIKKHFFQEVEQTVIDYGRICIRFDIIKNLIQLNDTVEIKKQILKLRQEITNSDINENIKQINNILDFCFCGSYTEALKLILQFNTRMRSLTVFIDPEIMAMKLEMKALEIQISSLEDEKIEIEKLLFNFEIRHNKELGDLIKKLLYLRKEKLKKEAEIDPTKNSEAEEAQKEFENFTEDLNESSNNSIAEISEEDKLILKTNFRKASKMCHPDIVHEKFKESAEQTFRELRNAYELNDIEKVNEILLNLEKGIFTNKSNQINEKLELTINLNQLRIKRDKVEKDLKELKLSDVYKTVASIDNWDKYFSSCKMTFTKEIEDYERGLI